MATKTITNVIDATDPARGAQSIAASCDEWSPIKCAPRLVSMASTSGTAPAFLRVVITYNQRTAPGSYGSTAAPLTYIVDAQNPPVVIRHSAGVGLALAAAGSCQVEGANFACGAAELAEKRTYNLTFYLPAGVQTTLAVPNGAKDFRVLGPGAMARLTADYDIGGFFVNADIDRNSPENFAVAGVQRIRFDPGASACLVVFQVELP
jgi:hypothetical protein